MSVCVCLCVCQCFVCKCVFVFSVFLYVCVCQCFVCVCLFLCKHSCFCNVIFVMVSVSYSLSLSFSLSLSLSDQDEKKLKGVIYFQAIEEVYYDHLRTATTVSSFFISKSLISQQTLDTSPFKVFLCLVVARSEISWIKIGLVLPCPKVYNIPYECHMGSSLQGWHSCF